jgi:hypothetical protein
MARQNLNLGSAANDGTGDTLRVAGQKINQNFAEIYETLSGDSGQVSTGVALTNTGITFEGVTVNGVVTTLTVANPSTARTATLPDHTGIIVLDTATQSLTNKTIVAPILSSIDIQDNDASHVYNIVPGALTANTNINIPSLADSDTFVLRKTNQTLTNKTLSSPVLNTPRVGTSINDINGNEVVRVTAAINAINEVTIVNAAAGAGPQITSTGGDSDIDLTLTAKGAGNVVLSSSVVLSNFNYSVAGAISSTSSYVTFSSSTNIAMTLNNGTTVGQMMYMANTAAGVVTITPTTLAASTATDFNLAQYQSAQLIWGGTPGWFLVSRFGADSAA